MAKVRKVGDYISGAPHHLTLEATLHDAQRQMRELGVTQLPVLDGGVCRGVVFERDVRLLRHLSVSLDTEVRALLMHDEFSVAPDESLASAVRAMASRAATTAVVMDGHEVRGVLTAADVLRVLAEVLEAERAESARSASEATDGSSLLSRAEQQAEQLLSGAGDRSEQELVKALRTLVRELYEVHSQRLDRQLRELVCNGREHDHSRQQRTQEISERQRQLLENLLVQCGDDAPTQELARGVKQAVLHLRAEFPSDAQTLP